MDNRSVSSSKRLMMTDDDRNSNNNRSSVSVHQVVFNDDLLIEILLRLPVISLLFFKSVSKRWLSLITSPAFFNLHVTRFPNIHSPCGFFLQKTEYNHPYENNFVSLNSRIPTGKKRKKSSAFTFGCFGSDATNVRLLQSCNGLVLCVISRTNAADRIYVYNPSINMSKMLPQVDVDGLKSDKSSDRIRLAFDPTKSPHYKVLHARVIAPGGVRQGNSIQTRIYSSETGSWRIGNTFPFRLFCGKFDKGVYWNDAIHWLNGYPIKIHVMHFDLEVEHENITSTLPPQTLDCNSYTELFESRGCLLLACAADRHHKRLKILEMRNGYSWSVRYTVRYYKDGIDAFFESRKMFVTGFRFKVLFIVVGEREEESCVVLDLCGIVVKYNILLKTLHVLYDIDPHVTNFGTFPFIASFSGV